jgi:hypothetical protein
MTKLYRLLIAVCLLASCVRTSGPVSVTPEPDPHEPDAWMKSLPVPPGESLKAKMADRREKQVITFFDVTEIRDVKSSVFIAGTGYVEINGGGTIFAGPNRKMDPFIEATITNPRSAAFEECRSMLVKADLREIAVRLGGDGFFAARPGVGERRLAVVRIDAIDGCKVVPRR